MRKAVIEDWDQFYAFLAAQPLCQWSVQKQRELASGSHLDRGGHVHPPPKKDDNAELAAALAAMA